MTNSSETPGTVNPPVDLPEEPTTQDASWTTEDQQEDTSSAQLPTTLLHAPQPEQAA